MSVWPNTWRNLVLLSPGLRPPWGVPPCPNNITDSIIIITNNPAQLLSQPAPHTDPRSRMRCVDENAAMQKKAKFTSWVLFARRLLKLWAIVLGVKIFNKTCLMVILSVLQLGVCLVPWSNWNICYDSLSMSRELMITNTLTAVRKYFNLLTLNACKNNLTDFCLF